ncbi:hypothetical protein HanXRQr2_Chr06g0266741 [Helianthus annuus]|uniref:Uncharacterized protein n=1 Tax=Helianthus annuus TaxID=4232 RepID=A0A9K3IU08_HELAN|nr:hypothetical protein HanXRQr2_Chr06g0266741 [Helianthus annuus]
MSRTGGFVTMTGGPCLYPTGFNGLILMMAVVVLFLDGSHFGSS